MAGNAQNGPMMRPLQLLPACALLALGASAQAQTPPPLPSLLAQTEIGIVWGVPIQVSTRNVFDIFSEWMHRRSKADPAYPASIVNLAGFSGGRAAIAAGVEPNARMDMPKEPLRMDGRGENYQAINVAVVSVDLNGKPLDSRPLGSGFAAGERFKLRVLATFDAMVVLGNVNPMAGRKQIYPAKAGYAVSVPPGKEVLLPLGDKEYFKFSGATEERLTFTVRDPRSLDPDRAATGPAFRRDEGYGSSFVQAVAPERFPVIAESIALKLRAAPR